MQDISEYCEYRASAAEAATFHVKDPISALTHFAGFLLAIVGMPLLMNRAAQFHADKNTIDCCCIFMLSMIVLYGASSAYHAFHVSERVDLVLKKIDHMSIFLLIAGTYTPFCGIALKENSGDFLLILVWAVAAAGILFKAFWVTCPKWVSSIIYIGMGWMIIPMAGSLLHVLPAAAFYWLLLGGIIYTIGGVIYALKLPLPGLMREGFGNHELFHLFVLGGSLCHYLSIYLHVVR